MVEISKNSMSLTIECERCKQKFEISSGKNTNQLMKREYVVDGESIFLLYYDCPKCARRHFVQIDNAISLRMLNDVKKQFVRLSIAKKKDKEIPRKQSDKFKKARKDLSTYRMKLMREYDGKSIFDEGEHDYFVLRFSV